tara:strand:- start:2296 stop:3231 length:936 start_codon:yes stop_codon:yes gene_type:complete
MKISIFLFFFLIFFLFSKSSFSEKISIEYTVNNEPITSIEIKNEITYLKLINSDLKNMDDRSLVVYATKSVLREKIKELEIKKYFKTGMNDEIVTQNLIRLLTTLGLNNINEFNILLSELKLEKGFVKNKIEIEILWNQLIFEKYKNKLSINEDKIKKDLRVKIESEKSKINEYNLSEILFTSISKSMEKEDLEKIKKSINEVGFENTAIIYSISSTASSGGSIGWLNKTQLSAEISEIVENLNIGEISEAINTPAGKLLLILKNKRKVEKEINFKDELNKAIIIERNKQLNQFSSIYFKKIELNTIINEK